MTLQEYVKLPKGEFINMSVGDKFRPLESRDDKIKIGDTVFFYEVRTVKSNGYEVMIVHDKLL